MTFAPPIFVGSAHDRRAELFQTALARSGQPVAKVISYADLFAGRIHLTQVVRPGALLRIDSPGRDWVNEKALLCAGAETPADGYARLSPTETESLGYSRGRIWYPRQWYLGLRQALQLIAAQLQECSGFRLLNDLADIAVMFDKPSCHSLLQTHFVAQPENLGEVHSFAELREKMLVQRFSRVFVKPAHGSGATGIVALHLNATRLQATTTVEMVSEKGTLRLFNTRRVRVYKGIHEVESLLDELCRHRVHVERWLPKASHNGRVFDLRLVVIGGQARHTVARLSRTPFTNLHLLNERGDLDAIRARIGEKVWREMAQTCESVMREVFPRSIYAGFDVLLTPALRRHYVLEVNAFGDLLPGLTDKGQDTYTAELEALCSMREH